MKKRGLVTAALILGISISSVFCSYAGEWKQDDIGWWWQEEGWYPTSCWRLINAKEYYFGADGYMLHDVVQDGFQLDSSGARVIPDIGLEVAPYKYELDVMIADNFNEYKDSPGFSLTCLNYTGENIWIDCGDYYKIENVELWRDTDSEDIIDIGILSEVRIRKDCKCLCNLSHDGYLKVMTLDEWVKRGRGIPELDIIFDDKGYIVGFSDAIAG